MSEYWKSTPKYWCKHCSVYVRDTKLERANHESTGKHQGAIKRSLRDLHREAEQKERDADRAKREVERLNGVVAGSSASSASAPRFSSANQTPQTQKVTTEGERQRQLEQLAELGVSIPTELRGSLAMVGEWTVTKTRVIEEVDDNTGEGGGDKARAVGVKRARERTEEEREQEEALNGLFEVKRPRRWGADSRRVGGGVDEELEALLSGGIVLRGEEGVKEEDEGVKKEEDGGDGLEEVKNEEVKKEEGVVGEGEGEVKKEGASADDALPSVVKKESDGQEEGAVAGVDPSIPVAGGLVPGDGSVAMTGRELDLNVVGGMFKKRKPKNIRQK